MKKLLQYFTIILVILLIVTGCSNKNAKDTKKTDNEKFKQEYEKLNSKSNSKQSYIEVSISKNNPIIYQTPKEVIERINNNELFIVFFGNNKDNDSRTIIESLLSSAKEQGISKIYYVDTVKYANKLDKLSTLLEEIGEDDIDYISAPSVVAIAKKKVVGRETGLDNEENSKKYAKETFNCLFNCLNKESTTCTKNSC